MEGMFLAIVGYEMAANQIARLSITVAKQELHGFFDFK